MTDFWAQLTKEEVRSSEFKWRNKIKIMNDEFGIMNYSMVKPCITTSQHNLITS